MEIGECCFFSNRADHLLLRYSQYSIFYFYLCTYLYFHLYMFMYGIPIQAEPNICRCASPSMGSIATLLLPTLPEQSPDNSCRPAQTIKYVCKR